MENPTFVKKIIICIDVVIVIMLGTIGSWINEPRKPARLIPDRQKYFNSLMVIGIYFLASFIPLFGGQVSNNVMKSITIFQVHGSLMTLGTQPYIIASMCGQFMDIKEEHQMLVVGFLLSLIQIVVYSRSLMIILQLTLVSWSLFKAMSWLRYNGTVNLTSGLLFLNSSGQFIRFFFSWGTLPTLLFVAFAASINDCSVPIPISHQKSKHQPIGTSIPIMYNGTTALIICYTVFEYIKWFFNSNVLMFIEKLAMGFFIYFMNQNLHKQQGRTGLDLIKQWKSKGYSIKGWRSIPKQGKYIENIIQQCLVQNTMIIILLWLLGYVFQPTVPLTTLLMMTELVQKHVPKTLW